MKILITGNMGYVGPNAVRQLRSSYPGAHLVGVDAGFFSGCLTPQDFLPETRLDQQIFADVRWLAREALEGVDAVVHLAAISNDPIGNLYEKVTMEINHEASVRLASLAKQAGAKAFVFASSCSVYGSAQEADRNEDSPLNPLTAYARSKVQTEYDLRALAGEGFTVTCLRFATACGISERLRLDLVLNDFVAGAVSAGEIGILSDGTPWRPLIDVKDMARALDWAVGRDPACGGEYLVVNAGGGHGNYQVKEIAEAVARMVPGVRVNLNRNAPPDRRSYRVNFDRFAKLAPDHRPLHTLDDSIAGLRKGLETLNFRDRDFRSSFFIRLVQLSHLREKGLLTEDLRWSHRPMGQK
ncbi:SDR family oxidoreductase [Geomonas sp. Red32]|uniref:NAD-dependent epimerase/dehydratase family protein n=1 Tax=Geomonas sp. Red32 TaxID=2912856 RepID=UPI00202CE932|nr:SDR family oxidoreductase [Geomonas sp. Red32]MCM0083328.1 SDR family oxidoreductase [Geomonas sp. Red32]